MANSPEFVSHALDLVALVGPVHARSMFGGHGLYARGVMFGLLDDDELFFKTDELCRPRFEAAACRRWSFEGRDGRVETGYFRPPDEAHEDPESMLPWATLALEAALRRAAEKAALARPRPRSASGAGRRRGAPARKRRSPARPAGRKKR